MTERSWGSHGQPNGGDQAPELRPLPPMVYVPAQELRPGDDEFQVELRYTEQGELALLVYSALDRLVDACGDAQPWALIRATDIAGLRDRLGYDLILLDAPLPTEERRTRQESLDA